MSGQMRTSFGRSYATPLNNDIKNSSSFLPKNIHLQPVDPLKKLAYYASLANSSSAADSTSSFSLSNQSQGFVNDITKQITSASSYNEISRILNKCLPSIHGSPQHIILCMKQILFFAEKEKLLSSTVRCDIMDDKKLLSIDDKRQVLATGPEGVAKKKGVPVDNIQDQNDALKKFKVLDGILCHNLKDNPSCFSDEDLIEYMYCLAKFRIKDFQNYRIIARKMESRPGKFSVQQLQKTLWIYTTGLALGGDEHGGINITKYDTEFLTFVSNQFIEKESNLVQLGPHELATVVKCLNRLSNKNIKLLHFLGKAILKKQNEFSKKDWALCVLAFTRLGVPLRDDCVPLKRPRVKRDWQMPPPPKQPKPLSQC